jgi:hypothetical protein
VRTLVAKSIVAEGSGTSNKSSLDVELRDSQPKRRKKKRASGEQETITKRRSTDSSSTTRRTRRERLDKPDGNNNNNKNDDNDDVLAALAVDVVAHDKSASNGAIETFDAELLAAEK